MEEKNQQKKRMYRVYVSDWFFYGKLKEANEQAAYASKPMDIPKIKHRNGHGHEHFIYLLTKIYLLLLWHSDKILNEFTIMIFKTKAINKY